MIYCHSKINVVQSNRIYNLKRFLVVTCGQFRVRYETSLENILLNSRMTNSPTSSDVGILITNPSGLLFHILATTIVSLGVPALYLSTSVDVMGRFISWSMNVHHSEKERRANSVWRRRQQQWCAHVCISESASVRTLRLPTLP